MLPGENLSKGQDMGDGHEITSGQYAIIKLTAQETVKESIAEFRKEVDTTIKIHAMDCKIGKLTSFKVGVISVISGAATLLGEKLVSVFFRG